jgi:hypothetical protein
MFEFGNIDVLEGNQEKVQYLKNRAEKTQNGIVSFKSAPTTTSGSMVWTYRQTYCDVISIVTTTVAQNDGAMKDIILKSTEIERFFLSIYIKHSITRVFVG